MKSRHKSANLIGCLFIGDERPNLLLSLLAGAFVLGCLLGQLLRFPIFEGIHGIAIPLADALGKHFIWLLTFFVHPLVASSVWCAVTKNSKSFGVAFIALAFFAVTTGMALFWGTMAGIFFHPGVGLQFGSPGAAESALSGFEALCAFIAHPFTSLWSEISLLGLIAYMAAKAFICVPLLPKATREMNKLFEIMQDLCMRWMRTILRALPLAVFLMSLGLVGKSGLGFLANKVGRIVAADVMAMGLHQITLLAVLFALTGGAVFRYVKKMFPAYLVALGSRSSMGTLPTTMRCAGEYGIPERISNFIFPFGATINMDGTCAHIMIALMTILQAQGVDITLGLALKVGATVMAASVATAAAPGASISLMRSVIKSAMITVGIGIQENQIIEMIALFASIDFFSDALRTQTNLFGDSMAALFLKKLFVGINWKKYGWARSLSSTSDTIKERLEPLFCRLPSRRDE